MAKADNGNISVRRRQRQHQSGGNHRRVKHQRRIGDVTTAWRRHQAARQAGGVRRGDKRTGCARKTIAAINAVAYRAPRSNAP
jgi:hypothetical protein